MDYLQAFIEIMTISGLRYFIIAGIPFVFIYFVFNKYFKNAKIQDKEAKKKDFFREVKNSMVSTLIFAIVAIIFTVSPLSAFTQIYTDINAFPIWWIPVSVIIALVVHDTYFYWMHRTLHHPKIYKKAHLVHHQSINPSPWASYSFHASEAVLEAMILPIIIILIPLHPLGIMSFAISSFIINVYGHLGFEICPKWLRKSFLFEIVNTSVHHNLHHSKFKGNYGLYFRVWDRIMETEHPDYVQEFDKVQEARFGKPVTSYSITN